MKKWQILAVVAFVTYVVRWKQYNVIDDTKDWMMWQRPYVEHKEAKYASRYEAELAAKDRESLCDTCFDIHIYKVREDQIPWK